MVPEAQMEDGDGGKTPAGEGWFIVNARDAAWFHNDKFGAGATLRARRTSSTTASTSRCCGRGSRTATTTRRTGRRTSSS